MTSLQIKTENTRKIILDVHRMYISEEGVRDFFWPVSYATRASFCQALVSGYTSIIQKYDSPSAGIFSYKLMAKYFVNEAITIFWADAVCDGFKKSNKIPSFPEHLKIWPAAFSSDPYERPVWLNTFRNQVPKASLLRKINLPFLKKAFKHIKIGRSGAKISNMSLKRITPQVLHNSIISTQRTPLIAQHSKAKNDEVVFCRSDRWFHSVSKRELLQESQNFKEQLEKEILDLVARLYQRAGISFEERSKTHISRILQEGAALIRIHEKRLQLKETKIPNRLWTGTAGYCWDTILRQAVMLRGGHVTGHDHGAGQGHVDNPITGFTELWGCNEYMTFNANQAQSLAQGSEKWPLLDTKSPQVTFPNKTQEKTTSYPRFQSPSFKIRTIAFLATIYDGDRGRMGPSSPDIVHVDWQARLISKLRYWGYDVVIKIHPESPILPPEAFTARFGARVETQKLEDVLDKLDFLLYDSVYTTALYAGLKTNMPMALIDFYQHPWTEKGRDLFMRRSPLLDGWFDENNRKQIDWEALRNAIIDAPLKSQNHQFFDYYYG